MDRKEEFYFKNSCAGNSYGYGCGYNDDHDYSSDHGRDENDACSCDDDYGYNDYDDDYGYGDYDDDYGYGDYDDDYGHDDDEIGYLNRELWEYEAEFDRAAREIERSHRSPAAKVLTVLIAVAAALAIYLGVSEYLGGKEADEPEVSVSFVKACEENLVFPSSANGGDVLFAEAGGKQTVSEPETTRFWT